MRVRDVLTKPVGEAAETAWKGLREAPSHITRRDLLRASIVVGAGAAGGAVWSIPATHDFGETFVLYTADACRADVIGKMINGMEVTPNLNRLAEKGLYFPKAYSSANQTRGGFAGLLTGEPACVHTVASRACTIPAMPTMATRLRERGYGTLATVNNRWLEAEPETAIVGAYRIGYSRGFEKYTYCGPDNLGPGGSGQGLFASDERVTRATYDALGPRWLGRKFPLPAFIWLHSMRTHWPRIGDRANEFTGRFHRKGLLDKHGREKIFEMDSEFIKSGPSRARSKEGEIDLLRAIYYEAAAYMDGQFGEFMKELGRHESGGVTVFFTADHGECLGGEDKEIGHCQGFGESVMRVPLVISGRDVPSGTVDKRVPNYCIMHTAMALLGETVADTMGFALEPRRIAADAPIYASTEAEAAYISPGGMKIVRRADGGCTFYDIGQDPGETAPLELDEARRTAALGELAAFEARGEELRKKRRIEPEYTRIGWQLSISGLSADEMRKISGVERESGEMEKQKINEIKALGYAN